MRRGRRLAWIGERSLLSATCPHVHDFLDDLWLFLQLLDVGLSLLESAGYLFNRCIECFLVPSAVISSLLYLLLEIFLELSELLVDLRLALETLILKLLVNASGDLRQLNGLDVLDLRLHQAELSRVVMAPLAAVQILSSFGRWLTRGRCLNRSRWRR